MSDGHRFRGEIYRVGMDYCVDVPAEASAALDAGSSRYVNVAGEVVGQAFRSRLTPRGGGAFRLFLNSEVRAAAGASLGDSVEVTLWLDEAPREATLPDDVAAALEAVEGVREAFEAMTEAQRTGMLVFLDRARTAATRERYVARIVENVQERMGD